MSILFNRCVSLQVGQILSIFARSIISPSQRCLFHMPSSCLCFFPPTHPFFFKDSDFLITIHFIDGSLSILFSFMFLPGVSHEDALLVRHSSFFSSPVDSIQAFGVDHILFPRFKYLLLPVLLIFIHFSLFNCSRVLKLSQKIHFHSQSVQAFARFLSYSSHLIQPVQSPFSSNHSTMFLLSGP